MNHQTPQPGDQVRLPKPALQTIFNQLTAAGCILVGPTLQNQMIGYDQIDTVSDLPVGWTDAQAPGTYRLHKTNENTYFSYTLGAHSWKKYLFPPELRLFSTYQNGGELQILPAEMPVPFYALIGVRACELAALAVQDRVFLGGRYPEPHYQARRNNVFLLAVNCTRPGETCFCGSLGTGPACESGFDLALTELERIFVIEVGTLLGAEMLAQSPWEPATIQEVNQANQLVSEAATEMGRQLDTAGLPDLLMSNLDHPEWDRVAVRCLSCANCTQVCPTCFCFDVEDNSDLTGTQTKRIRRWDSCFNPDFSHVHGGNLRPNIRARYRQWLTHKLGTWPAQFGVSGCVGCGRCITWCPAGIDLTEEVRYIKEGVTP